MSKKIIPLFIAAILVILSFMSVCSNATDIMYNTYHRRIYSETKSKNSSNDDNSGAKNSSNNEFTYETIDVRNMDEATLEKNMIEDLKNVSNFNRDIAGWINIPNVGYFPVMQCNNNSYYLSHNEYKEVEQNGAPFLDKDCDGFRNVSLIYGHHYSSGKMFGGLEKYKEQDFFFQNEFVTIYDGKYFYYYKPFSIYLFKSRTYSVQVTFDSLQEKEQYLQEIANCSTFVSGTPLGCGNSVLFLQTCDYSFYDARLVIAFKRTHTKKI